jgi:tricorn protease
METIIVKNSFIALMALFIAHEIVSAQTLFQQPTVNATHIVFAYADDLWSVSRAGGVAARLTSGPGLETGPYFSPDGKEIAFTADYEGNPDVYVMPAEGGVPRRLTYHPGPDRVVGWTPDGKNVLFNSARYDTSRTFSGRLFLVPVEGGFPEPLPLPLAHHGCFSPNGGELAYVPFKLPSRMAWKNYRGGTASQLWIANLADSSVQHLPRKDANDFSPEWIGDRIYFLSDREGPTTLFVYDLQSKQVRKLLNNTGEDLKSLGAGPDVLVYEQFGSIFLFDLATEKARKVDIQIKADLPTLQPRRVKVSKQIVDAALSPTGVRAVFEARGDIFTVPAKKGDIRNLTQTSTTAERDPAWSPDGKWIAFFSDESGEYQLHVRDQGGFGEVKKYALSKPPSFYYSLVWSPDSKKIAYSDVRLNLWILDLDKRTNTLVDTQTYYTQGFDHGWSPDSKWLTYAKILKNHLHAVFAYSLETSQTRQLTDGMSDARFPVFDRGGKYLYFTASTDIGPSLGGIEMSNFNYPVSRSVYIAVLDKSLPSPLAPESDEEKIDAKKDKKDKATKLADKDKKIPDVKIDLAGFDQRILALPLPQRNYRGLQAGREGILFLLEGPAAAIVVRGFQPKFSLSRFDLAARKSETLTDNVNQAIVSADGDKLLYKQAAKWFLVGSDKAIKPGEGLLNLDDMEAHIDPRQEWKEMYHEVWRIERNFLYDPGFHGLDLGETARHYRPYLDQVASRRDLNYLFQEMLSGLSLGHVYVTGGDTGETKGAKGGLLGADYTMDKGRYRFAKIYHGENWSPDLRAPLTGPGISVQDGEYLLAVSGKDVKATDNVHRFLEGTAGKSVVLRVGPNPDGKDAREITVVPVEDEAALRNRAWIDGNIRKVDELTKGKVAYVYLPDTAAGGYTNFNRYFFAQVGKDAVIIDERFNGGGKAADWVIDHLARPLVNFWSTRYGATYTTPEGQIFGPKVMIVNEQAGSGGDYLPWAFRHASAAKPPSELEIA